MDKQNNIATHKDDAPLFFRKLPLVCCNIPLVKPIICLNIPLININRLKAGFTIVELVITLTIAGILAAFAAPAMRTFISSQRLTTQANELVADFNLARSEAIKRSGNTGVCSSSNGASCGGTWQNGWIVFVDADNSRTWTGGDSVLRIHEAISNDVTVNSSASAVVFNVSGLLDSGTGAGDYTLCSSQIGQSRIISVATTGRPSMNSGTC